MTDIKKSLLGGLSSVQAINPRVAFNLFMKKPPGVRDAHIFFNDVKKCFRGSRQDLADLFVNYIGVLADDGDMVTAKKLVELALKEKETERVLKEALRLAISM